MVVYGCVLKCVCVCVCVCVCTCALFGWGELGPYMSKRKSRGAWTIPGEQARVVGAWGSLDSYMSKRNF